MFEETSQQQNQNQGQPVGQSSPNPNQSAPAAPPPPNLPTGGGKEPEDMLADVDPSSSNGVQRPAMSAEDRQNQLRQPIVDAVESGGVPSEPKQPIQSKESSFKHVAKIIGIIAVVILVGGGLIVAGWYGYNQFIAQPSEPALNTNQAGNQNQNTNQTTTNTNTQVNTPVAPAKPLDSDSDGLPDSEEQLYGTNPQVADTDNDGLTDRDEVRVFATDPNNPDTDGDGFSDGEEVNNGYDPKGGGRLLDIE